jgi:hypothetical protein
LEDEIQLKTNDPVKGTCSNISDSTKVNAVWHKFEDLGYQAKEIWTVDGSDIQPWALDAYMKGNIESKLLGMAK